MNKSPIVAICLVNRHELELLGPTFDRAFPLPDSPSFSGLLGAVDDADQDWWRERDSTINGSAQKG